MFYKYAIQTCPWLVSRMGYFLFLVIPLMLYPAGLSGQDMEMMTEPPFEPGTEFSRLHEQMLEINSADSSDWAELGVFDGKEISAILLFIRSEGPLYSPYELQGVPGISLLKLRRCIAWLYASGETEKRDFHSRSLEGLVRIDWNSGRGEQYPGISRAVRLKYVPEKRWKAGMVFSTDQGERWDWSPDKGSFGTDHMAGYVEWRYRSLRVTAGSFTISSGESLLFGGGFGIGKSAVQVSMMKRSGDGIRAFNGTGESGYYNGLGVTLTTGNWNMMTFFSHTREDAVIRELPSGEAYFSTLRKDGNHRSSGERDARGRMQFLQTGGSVYYETPSFRSGFNVRYWQFSVPFIRPDTLVYRYSPEGRSFAGISFHMEKQWGPALFFSENAVILNGYPAWITGILLAVDRNTDLGLQARAYHPGYEVPWTNALSDNSTVTNERGLFMTMAHRVTENLKFTAFLDIFHFPWMKSLVRKPSSGSEWQLNALYRRTGVHEVSGRWAGKFRESKQGDALYPQYGRERIQKLELRHIWTSGNWQLRTRIQGTRVDQVNGRDHGFLVYAEPVYSRGRNQFSIRLFHFDTGSKATIQYAYEKDVLYTFSVPPLSGLGYGYYVYARCNISSSLTAWIKYRQIGFENPASGINKSYGSMKNRRIKFQLRYMF